MNTLKQEAPETITLVKLKPEDLTDEQSRILSNGHIFPLAIHSTPAGEYDVPVYRMIEQYIDPTKEKVANKILANQGLVA